MINWWIGPGTRIRLECAWWVLAPSSSVNRTGYGTSTELWRVPRMQLVAAGPDGAERAAQLCTVPFSSLGLRH